MSIASLLDNIAPVSARYPSNLGNYVRPRQNP